MHAARHRERRCRTKIFGATFDQQRCADLPKAFDPKTMLEWKDDRLTYRRSAPPSQRLAVLEAFIATIGRVIATDDDSTQSSRPRKARNPRADA